LPVREAFFKNSLSRKGGLVAKSATPSAIEGLPASGFATARCARRGSYDVQSRSIGRRVSDRKEGLCRHDATATRSIALADMPRNAAPLPTCLRAASIG
jgi:hypothetical protein